MLNFFKSKIMDSTEHSVATGSTVTAEGAALVKAAGEDGVKLATGAANEQFVGLSLSQQLTPLSAANVEDATVPGSGPFTVTLANTPVGGTLRVVSGGVVQAAGNPGTTADQYSIAGNVVTFHAGQAGKKVSVSYRYVPTTLQARTMQGDIPPGGAASLTYGTVGCVTKGEIYTDQFDTSKDWSTIAQGTPVTMSANGILTIGGAGGTIPSAVVFELPTAESPLLGIRFTV